MTPEIEILRANEDHLKSILEMIEFEFVNDPDWNEPSDTSDLTDSDRQNPDIMSNVEAMEKTNEMICWFGRDQEGFVGLWRGSSQTPLEAAPVVRLDTEGQYDLRGTSVANYLLMHNRIPSTRRVNCSRAWDCRSSKALVRYGKASTA